MIKEGRFKAKPISNDVFEFESKNGPMVKIGIEMEFMEGPSMGQKLTFLGGMSGKGEEFTAKAMTACGWNGDPKTIGQSWDYQQVYVTVEHREYEKDGKTKTVAEVKYINALDDDGPGSFLQDKKMTGSKRAAFIESFGASRAAAATAMSGGEAMVKAARKPNGKTSKPAPEDTGPDVGEEDIPF